MSGTDLIPPDDSFIGYFARTSGQHTSAHEVGFMCQAIAVMSVVFGPLVRFPWGKSPGYSHVWVMQVGESAQAKKSTLGAASIDALGRMAAHGAPYVLHDIARPSDAGIAEQLDQSVTDESGDVTVPTLPVGQFIYFDELTSLMGDGSGRNVAQSVHDARNLLVRIHGGTLSSSTKATSVPRQPVSVTMVGNIVVEQFENLMSTSANVTSGFLGRWVPVRIPKSDRSFHRPPVLDIDRHAADERALDGWLANLSTIARRQRDTGEAVNGWDMLRTGSAADELHRTWYESYAGPTADLRSVPKHARPLVASMRDRWAQSSLGLAAFSAIARVTSPLALGDVVMDERDVQWAHTVIESADAYIRDLLEDAPADNKTVRVEGRIMRKVFRSMEAGHPPMSKWKVAQAGTSSKGERVAAAEANRVVDDLERAGHLITDEEGGYELPTEVFVRMESNRGQWPLG